VAPKTDRSAATTFTSPAAKAVLPHSYATLRARAAELVLGRAEVVRHSSLSLVSGFAHSVVQVGDTVPLDDFRGRQAAAPIVDQAAPIYSALAAEV
jgi:hypothetical protein